MLFKILLCVWVIDIIHQFNFKLVVENIGTIIVLYHNLDNI